MTSLFVLVAATSLGVEYGWQPIADGGIDYIIRLEPDALDDLRDGYDITSSLPADASVITRLTITAMEEELPNEGKPLPRAKPLRFAGPETSSRDRTASRPYRSGSSLLRTSKGQYSWLFDRNSPPPKYVADLKLPDPRGGIFGAKDDGEEDEERDEPEDKNKKAKEESQSPNDSPTKGNGEKPWYALTGVVLVLIGSLTYNGYQLWVNSDLRRRYELALGGLLT